MKKSLAYVSLVLLVALLAGCAAARSVSPELQTLRQAVPAEAPSAPALSDSASGFATGAKGSGESGAATTVDRLVIRNASLSVVVHDPAAQVEKISQLAISLGGFVVTSNVFETTFSDSGVTANQASITIRVPVDRLDEALKSIKADAIEVRSQTVTGEDVTQQYTDLQSRLTNLEAAEAQLREIMASATRTEDVMLVYNQLVQVRGEIEQVKGQMQYFEQSAKLSAISVDLIPDVAAQPLQIGNWKPQGTAKAAIEALVRALQFLGDAAIWAILCVLPVGLIFGVPLFFVVRAVARRRRAAKAKAAKA